MTTEDLKNNWQKYGVELPPTSAIAVDPIRPLKEIFMLCWGPDPLTSDALLFDTGGEQGAPAYLLKVGDGDTLVSVNPANPAETTVLGKLIHLG